MKRRLFALLAWALVVLVATGARRPTARVDVLVVGGGASGGTAGISAARLGVRTLIAEETPWLGGMLTAGGVGCIDGNMRLRAGLFGEFLRELERHYGGAEALRTGWVSNVCFEPSVGNEIFHRMCAAEPFLEVWKGVGFEDATKVKGGWKVRLREADGSTRTVVAKIVVDGTELGDVAAACGVGYDLGMESRRETGEDVAPERANEIIQDLTWTAILKDYGRDVTIPRPEGYDPAEFACSCINPNCVTPKEPSRGMSSPERMLSYGKLPGGKYMINWPLEGNDYYVNVVEMSPAQREKAFEGAKARTMRFLYFIQKELGMKTLGLADDEYPTRDRLPLIPYHRESRRIHGAVRFTMGDITDPYCRPEKLYRTSIAVGDYPIDHHHKRYEGTRELSDLHFRPVPSYGLPLGTLLPRGVEGLVVAEKSISVSNIVNGTTRLQPVVMQIGQAAGAVAALAAREDVQPSRVAVREVQRAVIEAGGYLMPYLDVTPDDPIFGALQRVGASGVMKGVGRSVGWSNETWFRATEPLLWGELEGLSELYPQFAVSGDPERGVTVAEAALLIASLASDRGSGGLAAISREAVDASCPGDGIIRRGEMAVLIDRVLDPFGTFGVDITGGFVR